MKKKIKKTNIIDKIVAVILVLAIAAIIYIVLLMLHQKDIVYASTTEEINNKIEYEEIEYPQIDIKQIIQNNTKNIKKEKIIKKEI